MRCFTGRNHSDVGALEPSYPEGNFEGNQLLGGSIGLSPLCHTQATQFARQNSDRPPPQFPKASSWYGIVHHLSGPMDLASTQNPVHWTQGPVSHAEPSHSSSHAGCGPPQARQVGGQCRTSSWSCTEARDRAREGWILFEAEWHHLSFTLT